MQNNESKKDRFAIIPYYPKIIKILMLTILDFVYLAIART
jgi:hypothetical protein